MITIHPIHLSHPIHHPSTNKGQKDDRKTTKRWQKDDRKMTGRCQKDLKEMTEGWQKDVRKIREIRMLLLLLNTIHYIISLLLLTSKEKALQSVTSLPSVCAWKHHRKILFLNQRPHWMIITKRQRLAQWRREEEGDVVERLVLSLSCTEDILATLWDGPHQISRISSLILCLE